MTMASGLAQREARGVEAEGAAVLARARQERAGSSARSARGASSPRRRPRAPARCAPKTSAPRARGRRRHQRARPGEADLRAHRAEQVRVGAGDAAVEHVAADRDDEALELPLGAADRERVEQRLRGVLVGAVAGVDDAPRACAPRRSAARPRPGGGSTSTSGCIASRFFTVSRSVSPFTALDVEALMLITSAPSRLPASSNEVRVRVEASKKRFTTSCPRSAPDRTEGSWAMVGRFQERRDLADRKPSYLKTILFAQTQERRCSLRPLGNTFDDEDFLGLVEVGQHHLHDLLALRGHDLPM